MDSPQLQILFEGEPLLDKFYFIKSNGCVKSEGSINSRTISKETEGVAAKLALEGGTGVKIEVADATGTWEAFWKEKKAALKGLNALNTLYKTARSLKAKLLLASRNRLEPDVGVESFEKLASMLEGQMSTLQEFLDHVELQLQEVGDLTVSSSKEDCFITKSMFLFTKNLKS